MEGALAGLKVLDLSMNLPGPYLTWLLSGLGAQVLKIENPQGGDYMRSVEASSGQAGLGPAYFASINRGKQSLAVNLKSPQGREILLRLLDSHDILVEGFRPGALERLGLGYAVTSARQPRLIQVSISGYGQEGPFSQRAGHDINYLALAGVLGLIGDRAGSLALPGVQVADLAGGSWPALAGLLAAVVARQRTGKGQFVDVAMFDGALSLASMVFGSLDQGLEPGRPAGMLLNGRYPCYGIYRTADGRHMSLGALEPKFWQNFCKAVQRPDLAGQQFGGPQIVAQVEEIFASQGRDQWTALLATADCCCEPVLAMDEAASSELVASRAMLERDAAGARHLASPLRLSDSPTQALEPAPALGQHTGQVLAGLGYSEAQMAELRTAGVIA